MYSMNYLYGFAKKKINFTDFNYWGLFSLAYNIERKQFGLLGKKLFVFV